MKKSLLLAASFAMAFAAGAQTQVGFLDAEALGLDNKPVLEDKTPLAETQDVVMTFLNGQEVSTQNPDFNGFKYVVVNGEYIQITPGIGGTSNGTGNLDGPTGGCIYNFEVKADGWLIVVSKISSNKNFYVFEGAYGEGPMPVAYTMGMDLQSGDYPAISQILFTLPADDMGYVDRNAADFGKYSFDGSTIAWPIRIATEDPEAVSGGNGTGVMMFPVFAEAGNYMVLATGSKMNTCGYIFVPGTEQPAVSIYGLAGEKLENDTWRVFTGEQPAAPGELGGLDAIIANEAIDANAPMFNVLGQRVNDSYKGLVIKNGKKFINK